MRPNIVLFMPDQLRADAVGCFGNTVVQTPNMDALAARGTRFTNAFAQNSVCSPSRASILTGWYPHTAGHRTLANLLKPWEPNLLSLLRGAGYHVAWPGHRGDTFAPSVTEASTDFCGFFVHPKAYYGPSPYPEGHRLYDAFYNGRRDADGVVFDFDEATVHTAEQWLSGAPPEPWVLFVPLVFPHCPFEVEEPWFSMHDRADIPAPLAPVEVGKPGFHRAMRESHGTGRLTSDDWAEIIATYYGMIARVDHQLGRVLDAVDRAHALDRTLTVLFTDHGEYAGDFGLIEKWPSGLDECLLRNPLIFAGPGVQEGAICDSMVELIDLLPTLIEVADYEPSHTHFGRSLLPVLNGRSTHHREASFSEGGFHVVDEPRFERAGGMYAKKAQLQHDRPDIVGKATSMRTPEWTYIHRLREQDELYDRRTDARETTNVLDDHPDVARAFRDGMLSWLVETSDVFPWEEDPRAPSIIHGYRS